MRLDVSCPWLVVRCKKKGISLFVVAGFIPAKTNWNVGILECWNISFGDNGIVELENQIKFNGIDFVFLK